MRSKSATQKEAVAESIHQLYWRLIESAGKATENPSNAKSIQARLAFFQSLLHIP